MEAGGVDITEEDIKRVLVKQVYVNNHTSLQLDSSELRLKPGQFVRSITFPDLRYIDGYGRFILNEVKVLTLSNIGLITLPALPQLLTELYCDRNQLTVLADLPASLRRLNCSNNQLTTLPKLPDLIFLNCSNNRLTDLPALPATLTELILDNNELQMLPALPTGLMRLSGLDTNPLEELEAIIDNAGENMRTIQTDKLIKILKTHLNTSPGGPEFEAAKARFEGQKQSGGSLHTLRSRKTTKVKKAKKAKSKKSKKSNKSNKSNKSKRAKRSTKG